jgi:hypothetical protein
MAKVKGVAMASQDPDATACFYIDGLGSWQRLVPERWTYQPSNP